jgi:hypothetical protein
VVGATSLKDKLASEMAEVSIGYPHSPIVGSSVSHGPRPGTHAPSVDGLEAKRHTAVVVGGSPPGLSDSELAVVALGEAGGGRYGPPGTLTLVRPDGYVGFVAPSGDEASVRHYFTQLLGIADFGA